MSCWPSFRSSLGGFGLDDALAICPDASVEAVARLVSRSLVALVSGPGEPRYRLPETIRQFAAAHLAEAPELAAGTSQRHAEHYLALAEQAEPQLTRTAQDDWLARLAPESDNLRAALAWTRTSQTPCRAPGWRWPWPPTGSNAATGASAGSGWRRP